MPDRAGQQFGNYRLVRLLGEGGFAEVYLGEHVHLGTQAAIKVLTTKLTDEGIALFRDEARTMISLEHPHIVRVHDFGIEGRFPFIVMSYAPNGSLRQRHPKGTHLPLPTIVSYVIQLATALQYAHDRRLIHRDIKPDNILVGRNNELLLSDFGLAVVAQSTRYLNTADGSGTISYMAPEQIQGKPRAASDQYALGIVVYEWLSGTRPFTGTAPEIGMQHLLARPPSLREKVPTISAEVEQIVLTALAKDPHQRFMSVQAFSHALEQACQPVQPRMMSPQPGTLPPTITPPSASPRLAAAPDVGPAAGLPDGRPVGARSGDEKGEGRSIDKHRVRVTLTGIAIYSGLVSLNFVYSHFAGQGSALSVVLGSLGTVALLFFGAVFGSRVGFLVALIGTWIYFFVVLVFVTLLSSPRASQPSAFSFRDLIVFYLVPVWVASLVNGLTGLITGLARRKTDGHYHTLRSLALAAGFSMLALTSSYILFYLNAYMLSPILQGLPIFFGRPAIVLAHLPYTILGLVLDLILLSIALFIYNAVSNRRRRVSLPTSSR